MSNPINVLFGRDVVSRLRSKPSALLRIAKVVKPLLMASLHPDRDPTLDPEDAASISEAMLILEQAEPDELEQYISEFLRQDRAETDKLALRDLRNTAEGLRKALAAREYDVEQLRKRNHMLMGSQEQVSKALWHWLVSNAGRIERDNPKAVRRTLLHHYRIIIEFDKGYKAFEFDLTGSVRRIIEPKYPYRKPEYELRALRSTYLFRGDDDRRNVKLIFRGNGEVLLGGMKNKPDNLPLQVMNGEVSPYLQVGMVPIFVPWLTLSSPYRFAKSEFENGEIIEILSIRRLRQKFKYTRIRKPKTRRQYKLEEKIKVVQLKLRLQRKEEKEQQKKLRKQKSQEKNSGKPAK